jgi:hypothetical protein
VGVVKRRVLRGLWRRLVGVGIIGPGLLGDPAVILPSAAPGGHILFGAAFALRPLRVARELGWCDHDYPRWDAHTMPICTCNTPVLGAPASIIGSEPQATGLRPFALPQSHAASARSEARA